MYAVPKGAVSTILAPPIASMWFSSTRMISWDSILPALPGYLYRTLSWPSTPANNWTNTMRPQRTYKPFYSKRAKSFWGSTPPWRELQQVCEKLIISIKKSGCSLAVLWRKQLNTPYRIQHRPYPQATIREDGHSLLFHNSPHAKFCITGIPALLFLHFSDATCKHAFRLAMSVYPPLNGWDRTWLYFVCSSHC